MNDRCMSWVATVLAAMATAPKAGTIRIMNAAQEPTSTSQPMDIGRPTRSRSRILRVSSAKEVRVWNRSWYVGSTAAPASTPMRTSQASTVA
jgi:hypothetical protein